MPIIGLRKTNQLVPGFVGESAVMQGGRPGSRFPKTGGLRRISLLVPKASADGLRQLALDGSNHFPPEWQVAGCLG
jgi:hypothetical protein